jgi:hypothetical protein
MENKTGKIKVLFKIGFLYHKTAFDPLVELFESDERYDVFLSCREESYKYLGLFNRSLESSVLDLLSREGHHVTRSESGFDVVFTGDTVTNHRELGRTILCFVNHGSGIKTIMYRNLSKDMDTKYHIFVEGMYRERKLHEKGCLGVSKVYTVGMPKLDPLFHSNGPGKREILDRLNLNGEKRTILYAPTYKPTSIYALKDALFEKTSQYNLVIKLHPYSWYGRYAPHSHHKIFEKRVKKYPHAVLIRKEEYSILPYLRIADTLLTEASSTMFEFLSMGKVGIIFDLDSKSLFHSDGMPLLDEENSEFLKDAFVHFSHPDDIGNAIQRAFQDDKTRKKKIDEARNFLFSHLDGNASSRVKTIVERLLVERESRNNP